MTRINLIPPSELCDKHLLAEYRELPRVFGLARHCPDAPAEYKLGAGHVKFFYDKLGFLYLRFNDIVGECKARRFKVQYASPPMVNVGRASLWNDYMPTDKDIAISRARIEERLKTMKNVVWTKVA